MPFDLMPLLKVLLGLDHRRGRRFQDECSALTKQRAGDADRSSVAVGFDGGLILAIGKF